MNKPGETLDLSDLDTTKACDKGYKLELKHPITKIGLGQFITVVGRDSTAFQEAFNTARNKKLREEFNNSRRGVDQEPRSVESDENENIELLVASTLSFENITFEGNKLTFSQGNARLLYSKLKFVRRQVDEAIAELGNFMKG